MRSPSRAEAKARRREARIEQRLEDLQHRLLDQTIDHRRDAQLALAAARLGDFHPAHRLRFIAPIEQCGEQRVPGLRRGRLLFLVIQGRRSSTVIPSTPGAPRFAFTRLSAWFRLAELAIRSISPRVKARSRCHAVSACCSTHDLAPDPPGPGPLWRIPGSSPRTAFRTSSKRSSGSPMPCCRAAFIEWLWSAPQPSLGQALGSEIQPFTPSLSVGRYYGLG